MAAVGAWGNSAGGRGSRNAGADLPEVAGGGSGVESMMLLFFLFLSGDAFIFPVLIFYGVDKWAPQSTLPSNLFSPIFFFLLS